jgi:hypothetical protein
VVLERELLGKPTLVVVLAELHISVQLVGLREALLEVRELSL